jgi:hypothetical protein
MKEFKKSLHKISQKIKTSKVLGISKDQTKEDLPNKPNIKKIILWIIGCILLAMILIGIGWFFGHQAMVRTENGISTNQGQTGI